MRVNADQLKTDLSSVVDATLATQVVDAYLEMQQRYHAGEWGWSELNGGKFCEAVARAVFELDSGTVSTALPGEIAGLLNAKSRPHKLHEKERDHFCRVLQITYKFRNDRGVAHISPIHTANMVDALLIIGNVKWMFAEFLRLAQNLNRDEVVATIEDIVQLEHPLIHELDGKPLVQSNGLTTPEEILVLLQHAQGGRLSLGQLREYIPLSTSQDAIRISVRRLRESRQVRTDEAGLIAITPLGIQRVREEILPKTRAAGELTGRAKPASGNRKTTARRKSPARKRAGTA